MKSTVVFLVFCLEIRNIISLLHSSSNRSFSEMVASTEHSIYQFNVKNAAGKNESLEKYKGKVVLIVNVASDCGYTNANYGQLKEILEKYRPRGFEVAAFPCNQFKGQEPGTESQICELINEKFNFKPDIYQKINVNGADEHPLFTFLKSEQGGMIFDAIKWNFTKFLVGRDGRVVARYAPNTEPNSFVEDIERELAKTQ